MKEATLVLIKPDGLVKSLTGNVLTRLSETKLEIVAARMVQVDVTVAKEHYKQFLALTSGTSNWQDLVSEVQDRLDNLEHSPL